MSKEMNKFYAENSKITSKTKVKPYVVSKEKPVLIN